MSDAGADCIDRVEAHHVEIAKPAEVRMFDRRAMDRIATSLLGTMVFAEQVSSCLVSDFTWSGARLWVGDASRLPDRFELRVERHGLTLEAELRWRTSDEVGVEFRPQGVAMR